MFLVKNEQFVLLSYFRAGKFFGLQAGDKSDEFPLEKTGYLASVRVGRHFY
jgi:hypothetical protein